MTNPSIFNLHRIKTLQTDHKDLIHDLSFDYYGRLLATCSGDQCIKIWHRNRDEWELLEQIIGTIKAPIRKVAWAHPSFGTILACSGNNKTLTIFECVPDVPSFNEGGFNFSGKPPGRPFRKNEATKYTFRQKLHNPEFTSMITDIAFAPEHLGLTLATVLLNGFVLISEVQNITRMNIWPTVARIKVGDASTQYNPSHKHDMSREKLKSYSLSWNKSRWEIPTFVVGCNYGCICIYGQHEHRVSNVQRRNQSPSRLRLSHDMSRRETSIIHKRKENSISRRWNLLCHMNVSQSQSEDVKILSVDWAPHLARKYHLIATGASDGFVRVIQVARNRHFGLFKAKQPEKAQPFDIKVVFEDDDHKSPVSRVRWNLTGTVLCSAGDDANIRVWKRNRINNKWIPICITRGYEMQRRFPVEESPDIDMEEKQEEKEIASEQPPRPVPQAVPHVPPRPKEVPPSFATDSQAVSQPSSQPTFQFGGFGNEAELPSTFRAEEPREREEKEEKAATETETQGFAPGTWGSFGGVASNEEEDKPNVRGGGFFDNDNVAFGGNKFGGTGISWNFGSSDDPPKDTQPDTDQTGDGSGFQFSF